MSEAGDLDLPDQMSRLEAAIEELARQAERCRKIGFLAKTAILAGAAWLAAMLLTLLPLSPLTLIASFTLMLGGTVLFGSNASTGRQLAKRLESAEELRSRLIDRLNLAVVRTGASGGNGYAGGGILIKPDR